MEPLVSVCIPAYNSEKTIKETMLTVLKQTYGNLELIIIDDCSSDGTVEKVLKIKERWENKTGNDRIKIRLIENTTNLGMAQNWNACLYAAEGEYIKLLCADDILIPEAIEKEAKALTENGQVVLVMSDTMLIDIHGKRTGSFKRFPRRRLMDGCRLAKISLMVNNFFGAPCNNLIRKSAVQKTNGFDISFKYIPDFDYWVTLACLGKVYILHEPLNAFRIRHDSNTGEVMGEGTKGEAYIKEHKALVEKHARLGCIRLNRLEIAFSVWWRRMRSHVIHIYLKIFTK